MTNEDELADVDSPVDGPPDRRPVSEQDRYFSPEEGVDAPEGPLGGVRVAHARVADWNDLVPVVVELVAERDGVDPETLDPRLNSVINPDALGRLFVRHPLGERYDDVHCSFPFHGYSVLVGSDGTVSLYDPRA